MPTIPVTGTPVQKELGFTPPTSGTPSCSTCPNAITDLDLRNIAGKSIGSPVCAIKMLPLMQPNQTPRVRARVSLLKAKDCDKYGKHTPIDASAGKAPLAFGEVGVGMPLPGNGQKVFNCGQCVNYIPPQDVAGKTGWNAGLCGATGKLLLPDRLRVYASECKVSAGVATPGPRASIDKFMFYAEYTTGFGEPDLAAAAKKARATDPLDWPTDREVLPEHDGRGIKAWRRIDDPKGGGKSVYIPIYRPDRFSEAELKHVPKAGDREHPELYIDYAGLVYLAAVAMVELDITPAVWGPPGVGKTELGRHLAWLMQLPFYRISVTGSMELDEIAGKTHFHPEKGTYFEYGRLPERWDKPGVIVLDEPNVGSPEVWQFLRPLTDNSRQLALDMNAGEVIPRDLDCYFYMAMNPAWDIRNVGTNTIGDADARRLLHLFVGNPPEDIERKIITERCKLDDFDITPHLDGIMRVAKDLRPLCDSGELSVSWGPAAQIKLARLFKWLSPMDAYGLAVLNYLAPQAQEQVVTSIQSVFPT